MFYWCSTKPVDSRDWAALPPYYLLHVIPRIPPVPLFHVLVNGQFLHFGSIGDFVVALGLTRCRRLLLRSFLWLEQIYLIHSVPLLVSNWTVKMAHTSSFVAWRHPAWKTTIATDWTFSVAIYFSCSRSLVGNTVHDLAEKAFWSSILPSTSRFDVHFLSDELISFQFNRCELHARGHVQHEYKRTLLQTAPDSHQDGSTSDVVSCTAWVGYLWPCRLPQVSKCWGSCWWQSQRHGWHIKIRLNCARFSLRHKRKHNLCDSQDAHVTT